MALNQDGYALREQGCETGNVESSGAGHRVTQAMQVSHARRLAQGCL